jgi:AraC-like DNA-binding protein
LEVLAIITSNALWLAGMIGLYAGLSQFLQRTVQWRPLILISIGFVLLYGYLVLFQPHDLTPRRLLFSLLATWLFGLMAWILWRHHTPAMRGSALFLAGVFAVESGFFLLRFSVTLLFGSENGQAGFSAEPVQVLTYLVAFMCSSLWTFGFILQVNQHLNLALSLSNGTDNLVAKQEELVGYNSKYLQPSQLHDAFVKRLQNNDGNKGKQHSDYVIKRMYEIRDRLQNDLQHTLTLDELAHDTGLNRNKINEHFKLLFGDTPRTWQRKQRLLLASRLLRESEMDIRDIARDTGHRSQASFSRAFKQHFGLSPSEFRASVQKVELRW